jgi:predicted nuclease of predicted toxin-antitoxin system
VRILCDHNVNEKYTATFRRTDWLTVATVRDDLSQDAADPDISEYAEREDWVVFTEDDDYLDIEHNRGLVLYIEQQNPSPGAVVDALATIADAYDDHRTIEEHVPDGWV